MVDKHYPYDPKNKESIISYARKLLGSTLRQHIAVSEMPNPRRRKGTFGNALEKDYFQYELNNDSNPDFAEVGLELKATPLKRNKNGKYVAKERLVITMINYLNVIRERFEASILMHKLKDILLVVYLYEKEKNFLDYQIKIVDEWALPEEDVPTIKADWELVVKKIRDGRAHEISGRDTLYLEACTKASSSSVTTKQPFSDIPAKPRAWALKASYMTAVENKLLKKRKMEPIKVSKEEEGFNLLDVVRHRFQPYFGLTEEELGKKFGYETAKGKKPKALTALLTRQILGVAEDAKIEQFEKAGIKQKTIRLTKTGRPKEAVSFPRFDYYELVETDFEDSDFYRQLQDKYLFVIYRESPEDPGVYRLADVLFWQMPDSDLEYAARCYEEMRARTKAGHAENSVKSTENPCCHVRPHARNKQDTLPTPPNGKPVIKKCFWLNQGYLAEEIHRNLNL
ncbi:Sau3AI family type II restriction endonuclease [uncultured Varibaculum sp.]|uniref:Sau3AI family type II restriction endonuclease n=1 Tax=uncultured Varibaculum sp. TaxID=413896 RepID=UPI0025926084|nr:Sau3AI family type II restriction endonuclease [uncultured Varibaculum sp.]